MQITGKREIQKPKRSNFDVDLISILVSLHKYFPTTLTPNSCWNFINRKDSDQNEINSSDFVLLIVDVGVLSLYCNSMPSGAAWAYYG